VFYNDITEHEIPVSDHYGVTVTLRDGTLPLTRRQEAQGFYDVITNMMSKILTGY